MTVPAPTQRPLVVHSTGAPAYRSLEKLKGKEHTDSVKAHFLTTGEKQDLESSELDITSSRCIVNFVLASCQLPAFPNILAEWLPYSVLPHQGSSQSKAGATGRR